MLNAFLKSLNGKLLVASTVVYITAIVVAFLVDKHIILVGTISYMIFGIWPWISNKRRSILFLSWFFKKLYAVELISFDGQRYYTLAKYDSYNKMTAPVYFGSNIGGVILLENGTTDPHSDSQYIKHWLPLNKSDRALHILKHDLPVL